MRSVNAQTTLTLSANSLEPNRDNTKHDEQPCTSRFMMFENVFRRLSLNFRRRIDSVNRHERVLCCEQPSTSRMEHSKVEVLLQATELSIALHLVAACAK